MQTSSSRFSKPSRWIVSITRALLVLASALLPGARVEAQTNSSTVNIETEMLTYRAVESNSEAISCDIVAFLHGGTANFTNPPAGSVCEVKAGTRAAKVILMPFDSPAFADFQIWRADMATMDRLQTRAGKYCGSSSGGASRAGTATPAASGSGLAAVMSMTPAGGPIALAQSAFALMSSQETITSVGGTVEDQAFMNGVGRAMRSLGMPVLMPTAYAPFAMAPFDPAYSPFLLSLDRTYAARDNCAVLAAGKDDKALSARQIVSEIDAYLTVLTETNTPAPAPAPASGAAPSTPAPGGGSQNQAAKSNAVAKAAPASSSHLKAVLSADGLAQKLGVERDTGKLPDGGASQHILLVKALESGGGVIKHVTALGTSIRYSGGAVGTYALFTTEGDLECSGNVYDYAGPIKSKDVKNIRDLRLEPGKQMVFLRGGCSTLAAH